MLRVPVLSKWGLPLMPTKPSRARRWLKSGKARIVHNDLGIFQIQLIKLTGEETQPVAVGVDPGKLYTGIGVQSAKFTLWLAHLQLPFKTVKDRMEQRAMMRRTRRGRRINRKVAFNKRAHRQKRFDNRRGCKIPPSIRANRELEWRVLDELTVIFPIETVVYEIIKARGDKGFSPVMVGQKWQLEQLTAFGEVKQLQGWETAQIRTQLGLEKQKHSKGDAIPATHAIDGVALACSEFIQYGIIDRHSRGWKGEVTITPAPFAVIRRPPMSRRQLHLMVPAKGGVRRKYGGTVTRHGFRKGDYVEATQGNKTYRGWVSGDTEKQISVSDANWKRLGQFSKNKVQLIRRSSGLILTVVKTTVGVSSTV
ncbi:RRXRR domain-containing protein [Scytonema hofmannii FACHB-248]|uniref:RRXRR domain-containing protein n=1 Tax=Scytonema hofmannii FACHB-248 TaxID=1842502 RepID=A0ABR8GVJ8_9CYAN|nr:MULTISPECIES: RRXRR domain-containing protein [Nostocales]MBD2607530.1 RRXRR domain-containing protein [Scytonema hofmannii FACHB-248]